MIEIQIENKPLFVKRINAALIECGAGRYRHLHETPLTYTEVGHEEFVACGDRRACVTLDSLPAMMADMAFLF